MIKMKIYWLLITVIRCYEFPHHLVDEHRWKRFHRKVSNVVLSHPVVIDNTYTKEFSKGELSSKDQAIFVQQFSVFSQLFLVAQLLKIINAPSKTEMRDGKEILCNELGVVFNSNGSIEGGTYSSKHAHFEWLLDVGKGLGLDYNDLGKRCVGSKSTLYFCDELERLYGSQDDTTAIAASYAIENWAQAGFWDELIKGFSKINKKRIDNNEKPLPMAFWKFHSQLEKEHAAHTEKELKDVYLSNRIKDEELFLYNCEEMLDAIERFWLGLNKMNSLVSSQGPFLRKRLG